MVQADHHLCVSSKTRGGICVAKQLTREPRCSVLLAESMANLTSTGGLRHCHREEVTASQTQLRQETPDHLPF